MCVGAATPQISCSLLLKKFSFGWIKLASNCSNAHTVTRKSETWPCHAQSTSTPRYWFPLVHHNKNMHYHTQSIPGVGVWSFSYSSSDTRIREGLDRQTCVLFYLTPVDRSGALIYWQGHVTCVLDTRDRHALGRWPPSVTLAIHAGPHGQMVWWAPLLDLRRPGTAPLAQVRPCFSFI